MGGHGYRGLFYFQRRLHELAEFQREIHMAAENRWTPQRRATYDGDQFVCDFFFVPTENATAGERRWKSS